MWINRKRLSEEGSKQVSKSFRDQCRKADARKRRGDPPLHHPEWNGQWPKRPDNIPANWDEMSLDQLYELFLAQHRKRLADRKGGKR